MKFPAAIGTSTPVLFLRQSWQWLALTLAQVLCQLAFAQQPAALLSPDDEEWLNTHNRTFRVGAEVDHPPYAFIENGEFRGLVADYLDTVSERLDIQFVYEPYETFGEMLQGIEERRFDILPLLSDTEERRAYLTFTTPIAIVNDRILVREGGNPNTSLEDLAGAKLGTVAGYSTLDPIRANHPEIQIVEFVNERAALLALSLGRIDAVVADSGVASYALREEGITNVVIGSEFGVYDFQRIGIRSDWPELRDILNKGLASISPEERLTLNRRWVDINPDEVLFTRTQLGVLIAAAILLALIIIAWIYSLRRLVERRTRKLHRELEERHRIEAANSRLVAAIEQAGELILLLEPDGTIEYVNLALIRAIGRHPGRATFAELAVDGCQGALEQALPTVGQSHERWHDTVELKSANSAAAVKVSMTVAPLLDHGELAGFVVTGQDITASSQLAERLRQAEKLSAVGTLASGIAHDFNNLLVPIMGSAELLRLDTDESAHELLDAITASAERSRQLIQSLLAFSRQGAVKREPLDLRDEVASGVDYLRSILPANITLQSKLAGAASILGNAAQIQQVLLNLASNAADAMSDKGGKLEIQLRSCLSGECRNEPEIETTACCELIVSDEGCGIEPDDIDRIFEPYFSRKAAGKGTGLGLATVYRIVKDHGGSITVDSTPGEGTRFRLLFPAYEPDSTEGSVTAPKIVDAGESRRPVMLVDDDRGALDTISKLLKVGGYSVVSYEAPADALAALRANPDDWYFLISDQNMPGMRGTELLEAARRINPRLPVMLLSGQSAHIKSHFAVLGKPVRLAQLVDAMDRIRANQEATA